MEEIKRLLANSYLSNLQVSLVTASYSHNPKEWICIRQTAQHNMLYLIYDGDFTISINNMIISAGAGHLLLIPEGAQYYVMKKNVPLILFNCYFKAHIGDINLFDIIKVSNCIDILDMDKFIDLFKKLLLNYNNIKLHNPILTQAILLEIIAGYIENAGNSNIDFPVSPSANKLYLVIEYIDCHFSEEISIGHLAKIMNFHPNYFYRFFKSHMGCSPIHYINKCRLEKAKNLLKSKDLTVTEVANKVGIYRSAYFWKIFKEYTGISPSKYRQSALPETSNVQNKFSYTMDKHTKFTDIESPSASLAYAEVSITSTQNSLTLMEDFLGQASIITLNKAIMNHKDWNFTGLLTSEKGSIILHQPTGGFAIYTGQIFRNEILEFNILTDYFNPNGWPSFTLRTKVPDISVFDITNSGYLLIFKTSVIEFHRFDDGKRTTFFGCKETPGIYSPIPNEIFTSNKTHLVRIGALDIDQVTRIIVYVDNSKVIDFFDLRKPLAPGYFGVYAYDRPIIISMVKENKGS